ncbi:MAG: 7TM domain-containing protein [Planctomycetota bacterium]
MSSRSLSQIAIVSLLLVGGLGLGLRYSARSAQKAALEDSLWQLRCEVDFTVSDEAEVRIPLPADNDTVRLVETVYDADVLTGRYVRLKPSGTRELAFSTQQLGDYEVTAKFHLRLRPSDAWGVPAMTSLSGDTRARYLRREGTTIPTGISDVGRVIRQAEAETDTEEALLQWVFDFCAHKLRPAPPNTSSKPLGALKDLRATPLDRARLMVTLCRAAGMPARLVTGFELRQSRDAKPHTWVEVFRDARWLPFDPEYGHTRRMPEHFVALRLDGERVIRTKNPSGVDKLTERYSIVRLGPPGELLSRGKGRAAEVFDLTRLPVEMHEVLSLLLLLPLGALLTAFFRNIVGVPTFGTFAPALFAVSFIYADWGTGLITLAVVLAAGLAARSLVGRLRLLMVPRLSIILTVIILCVVFGVSALDYLQLTPSANAVLLPLVIVTILIERFYVTIEEDGVKESINLLAGTVFVAAACYLLLSWDAVGQAILIYPEAHLVTIALFIAIGRYAGYRLAELWRFRDLLGSD